MALNYEKYEMERKLRIEQGHPCLLPEVQKSLVDLELSLTEDNSKHNYDFTSKRNDYLTPPALIDRILDHIGQDEFFVDTCCTLCNIPAILHFTERTFDGLRESWGTGGRGKWAYCNPPYDECDKWVKKAYEEQQKGNQSVLLIPARTETKYWHKYILENKNVEIDWLQKGWRFLHPETGKEMGVF